MSDASFDVNLPNLISTDFVGIKSQVNVNGRFGRNHKSAGFDLKMSQINESHEFGYVETEE